MAITCKKADCTVAQTGICLLNNSPEACPERLLSEIEPAVAELGDLSVPPPLSAPERNPRFPSSLTLTPDALRDSAAGRMFRMVGVLGAPDAGKTAILVSLYLLLSRNKLAGFRFADSMSLLAFDEISRGARRWNDGQPPEQMTNHTEQPDHRSAGFLHLRLRDQESGARHDILLPDLPGEWSTSLIDSNRVDRLDFLKAADVIWVTVDGRQLIQPQTRQQVLHRTGMLLQRVSEFLGSEAPPVFVVISHKDLGDPSEASLRKLESEAARVNVPIKILQVSSFSDNEAIDPGTGIAELIAASLVSKSPTKPATLWPDSDVANSDRQFLNFRIRRVLS
ncbi:TRAFAC clade GTPase domain-containing protein [Acidicapsa ligni]|uniref:TRAFAC clade GTPase domain-containing protein n=1 Tax=Acidicapsa ligni TaxID=542300 RepID=UPI0021DF43B1|nr:hypothetical protein [Acidicapsa ligni]